MGKDLINQITDGTAGFFRSLERDQSSLVGTLKRKGGYAMLNRLIGLAVPFATRNHFEVLELRPGYLKARVPFRGNRNHIGSLYAGAMFLLAEIPGGVMILFELGSGYVPVLKELTMSYVKLARTDVTVEFSMSPEELQQVRETTDRDGKADYILKGELKNTSGEIVARSLASYQLRRKDV